jgi:hypothetical protein
MVGILGVFFVLLYLCLAEYPKKGESSNVGGGGGLANAIPPSPRGGFQ